MPRSNRPRGAKKREPEEVLDISLFRAGVARIEEKNGVPCKVQPTNGRPADEPGKTWACPNCNVPITWGTAHLVAWPADLDAATRRHFHNHCWKMYRGHLG